MNETPQPKPAPVNTRRRFLNGLWIVLGLAALTEFAYLIGSFLGSRKKANVSSAQETIITAGPVDQFVVGTVTAIPQGQFYLSRLSDGSFLALSRTCTHLGCSLPWDEEKQMFVCPCHGSTFSMQGEVLTAPAPRPLDYYPVKIENNIVKVDIGAPAKRERFEPPQAARI